MDMFYNGGNEYLHIHRDEVDAIDTFVVQREWTFNIEFFQPIQLILQVPRLRRHPRRKVVRIFAEVRFWLDVQQKCRILQPQL